MADYIHIDKAIVRKDYFEWLKSLVDASEDYSMLWWQLHHTDYVWIVDMDENRAADGKYLRYSFTVTAYDRIDYNPEEVEEYLSGPCSVFEMLVALAKRIEHDIMDDIDEGDRTGQWFNEMIANLGLDKYDDAHYNSSEIEEIVWRFMGRKYPKNGKGNVFLASQKVGQKGGPLFQYQEIWTQMQNYFLEKYGI